MTYNFHPATAPTATDAASTEIPGTDADTAPPRTVDTAPSITGATPL